MKGKVELIELEHHNCCMLDLETSNKEYYKQAKIKGFTGLYFRDNDTFFAIFPSQEGPVMYYEGKQLPLTPVLHISLEKGGEWREFTIEEYGIQIRYRTSKYIGFDVWSTEKDVDLFYQIYASYKDEDYYKKFTMS